MSDFEDTAEDASEGEEFVKSKSQIKKEMLELQAFGESMVKLADKQFQKLPLEGQLQEAIVEARRIKHREGRRRQLQYIGKLMRTAELDAVREAYDKIQNAGQINTRLHHEAEQWRDQLLSEDKQHFQKFLEAFPTADIQYFRQLIRNAQKEASQKKPPTNFRKLFKEIREMLGDD